MSLIYIGGGAFLEIKVGYGCCGVVFGMTEKGVIDVLGQPSKEYFRYITKGCNNKVYRYDRLMLMLVFAEEKAYRLYDIEVYDPSMTLLNCELHNKGMDEVTSFLHSQGYITLRNEEYDTFDVILCDELNMEFHFEFHRLTNICFSPLWENDTIAWPIGIWS